MSACESGIKHHQTNTQTNKRRFDLVYTCMLNTKTKYLYMYLTSVMSFFLISATLNFSKTRGGSMWKYAKVEMKPPSFDEFPQIKQSINNIIVGAKTQKFMKMPVKVISQQSRFLAHLDKGPCKLFSSLDLRSPESKVHMRKCHHYDCRLKTFTFQSSSPKNH